MKAYFLNLQQQLDKKIEKLAEQNIDSVSHLQEVFEVVKQALFTMNEWQQTYKFRDETEEMYFFKSIRPKLTAQFIHYQALYEWESKEPLKEAEQAIYYKEKHEEVKSKLDKLEYIQNYLKAEENKHYPIDISPKITPCSTKDNRFDWRPCLQQCLPIAEYMSYKLQLSYLKNKYSMLRTVPTIPHKKLSWNRKTIDMSELLFALYHMGVIGDKDTTLKEIALILESVFDITISPNLNKRWRDINKRKQEPARFLKELVKAIETSVRKS